MNDICEVWSMPWHALQRNLALALGGDVAGHSGRTRAAALNVQAAGVSAGSWLSRAQRRTPPPQVRQ
jgi:hypothetical protein